MNVIKKKVKTRGPAILPGLCFNGVTSKVAEEAVSDLTGVIGGSYISEKTGNYVKENLDGKEKMKIKSNLLLLIKLIFMCLMLFLFFDVILVLLGSSIIYFDNGFFAFNWNDVFISFFKSGYVGGLILGVGILIKIWLKERKKQKSSLE
ncbi:hypothetical protein [Pantoea sp. R13S299]|uniref:hypothetical protein n=1 Tax=Pantoea sp. R13S299 TaxID=3402751 RepID=UPI003ADE4E2F